MEDFFCDLKKFLENPSLLYTYNDFYYSWDCTGMKWKLYTFADVEKILYFDNLDDMSGELYAQAINQVNCAFDLDNFEEISSKLTKNEKNVLQP